MKIAMIGHKRIPSREGGVEVVVEELATRMVKKGHDVVCYNRGGKHVAGSKFNKEELKEYKGIKLKKVITIDKKGLAAMTSSFFATIKALFSKAKVVHYHAEGPCAMMWIIKWFSNKKIIATIHGLDWQRAKWGGFATKYIKFGEKMAAKYADEIIVLSENVKKYFKDTYNRDTIFIPNGVNLPEIKDAKVITEKYDLKNDDYILYLGRIVPEKGIHYLIEAFSKIKTDKKLVIAGGASDTDSYYNEIKELAKKDDRVILTGFVQGEELYELFSNAYIYCLPSDLEGMPLSLLEAMSYGNCCLTSNIDECSEVLEDKGVTFEKSNVKDLEKKLNDLIINEEKVKKYKENAQEFILNKYDWDDVTDKTLELYEADNKNKKNKINLFFIILLLIMSVFGPSLKNLTKLPFNYADDFLAIYILIVSIIKIYNKEYILTRNDILIIILLSIIDIIGLIGNITSGFQMNFIGILFDCLSWQKFIISYIGFKVLIYKKDILLYYDIIYFISKIIIIISLIFAFFNLIDFIDLCPYNKRFGLNAFSIMGHPSSACAVFAIIICFLLKNPKKNLIWICLSLLLEILTLRTKAFAFVLAVPFSYILFRNNKNIFIKIFIFIVAMLLISASSIKFYFFNPSAARAKALSTSIKIANEYFPFGSGFATFGTNMSGQYYSQAYQKYNLDNSFGFMKDNYSFVGDGGWATIIAQFGYLGLIGFVCILILIGKGFIVKKKSITQMLPIICLVEYFFISSTNEPALNNSYMIFVGLFLVIFEMYNDYSKLKNYELGEKNDIN